MKKSLVKISRKTLKKFLNGIKILRMQRCVVEKTLRRVRMLCELVL